ncbi:MAG: L-aspartate oxidase [Ruminococcaceae bacterium]|nr:L-aspartate oxidase [Oscillospiraceae bacterium]
MIKEIKTDIVIAGCGVSGLYSALNLPEDKKITIITKSKAEESDSFLAQGGICVLKDEDDYEDFYNDTLKAGHFENNPESVEVMIKSSRGIIDDLVKKGVRFTKEDGEFLYTKEGAHSKPRILFHKDETGKEITSHLLNLVKLKDNITLLEEYTMVDILTKDNKCYGIVCHDSNFEFVKLYADYTIFATGGIGGLFNHSTNFPHLTGDALYISLKHNIELENIHYIQIHPTTLYTEKKERSFLISESVRGEGAVLLNRKGERFVNELLPRDVVTKAIYKEMEKENSQNVWLSLCGIPKEEIKSHFPNILSHCKDNGYDITKDNIPIVPAQHYFMGGIKIDLDAKTSMKKLYAVGETACNGVHGKNRLASNSLLESLVFAKRASLDITKNYNKNENQEFNINIADYDNYQKKYKTKVREEIEKEKLKNE